MPSRLSCSGAATARPAVLRACASCTSRSVYLSATVTALLLCPVRHGLHWGTGDHALFSGPAAQQLVGYTMDAHESPLLRRPIQCVAGSAFISCDTAFSRAQLLWGNLNHTSVAGLFPGPAETVCSSSTASTTEFLGLDSFLVILGGLWARISREVVHFYAMTKQTIRMELCHGQHPLKGHSRSVFTKSATSITIFFGLIYVFMAVGLLAAAISPMETRSVDIHEPHMWVKFLDAQKWRVDYLVTKAQIYGVLSLFMGLCCFIRKINGEKTSNIKHLSYNNLFRPVQLVFVLILFNINSVESVCTTCRGAVDGCAGGSTCPWLTTVATNAAAVVATATTGLICAKSLLPPGLLQAFSRSALDNILLLARMPAAGTPFSMSSTTTVAELRMAYRQGRISKSDVAEGISTLVSNVGSDAADLTRLQMQIKTIELELSEPEPQARTELGGVYVYIMAKISQFVLKSQAPGWVRTVQEKSGASMAAALHFPAAGVADATVPMMVELFVLFVHAFGLEHLHTVGPFVHKVVHESVLIQDYTWLYAFELLIIYLKVLDERRSNVSMGSIWESGSQDTFAKNAEKAARQRWGANFMFFRTHGGNPGKQPAQSGITINKDQAKLKWNGKFTKGAKPCLTFNNGRDNHPRACLMPDGTCKFDHVCDHFLEGGQKCLATDHGRHACTNPNKSERRQQ